MTNQLTHAEIIKHMVDFGYDSVEYQVDSTIWYTPNAIYNPLSKPRFKWRIKPIQKTICINNFPASERKALENGESYFFLPTGLVDSCKWLGSEADYQRLEQGLVYKKEGECTKAMNLLKYALVNVKKD